jgi:glycosyltransferase involved in cell wall biosynthesis
MKILYLTNGYPPHSTAGTENYTAGIATALAKAGHEVRVLCGGDWDKGEQPINGVVTQQHDSVTVSRINLNWARGSDPNHSLYDNPAIAAIVEQTLHEFEPDIVHITSCYTLSASIIRPIKASGYPLVITLTDFWFLCPRASLLRSDGTLCDGQTTAWTCLKCLMADSTLYQQIFSKLPDTVTQPLLTQISHTPLLSRQRGFRGLALNMAERKSTLLPLLNQADALIAPSKFLADMYVTNGLENPIQVEWYGHDLSWLGEMKIRQPSARLTFGFIGRITESKGVHVLAEAASQMRAGVPVDIKIWGNLDQEPEYARRLTAMVTENKFVTFCGAFRRDAMAHVYDQIDVLVVPSVWYENNPLVIQEAFAAGIPVIASNLGGMSEFVTHNVNGLLFEAGDADALVKAMIRFIDEPNLYSRLRAGLPAVRTAQQEVETLTTLYHRLARTEFVHQN